MNAMDAVKRISILTDEITALAVGVEALRRDHDRRYESSLLESMRKKLLKEKSDLENRLSEINI